MNDPYEVFGIAPDADEGTIRRRYLQLVRQHPPERDPERFAAIHAAYDQVRNPIVSLERRLFSTTATQSFEGLLAELTPDVRARRIPVKTLLSLART